MIKSEYSRGLAGNLLPALLMAGLSILAGGGIVAVVENTSTSAGATRIIYGLLSLLAFFVIFFQVRVWGWSGLLNPLSWCMVGFLIFLCLMPIVSPYYFAAYNDLQEVLRLSLYILAGILGYSLGFGINVKVSLPGLHRWFARPLSPQRLALWVLGVMGLYFVMAIYIARLGGYTLTQFLLQSWYMLGGKQGLMSTFGSGYYIIFIFRILPLVAATPAAYCLASKRIPLAIKMLLIAGLALMLLVSVSSGGRGNLVFLASGVGVYFLLGAAFRRDRHNGLSMIGLSLVALVISTSIVFVTAVQFGVRQQGGITTFFENDFDFGRTFQTNIFSQTTDQNFTLYHVLQAEEAGQLEYLWGESYALTFVAMIPRSLWPEKPGGESMYQKLAVVDPWRSNFNISHSVLGELVYNFSSLAVLPGMIFFGFIAGQYWRTIYQFRQSDAARILYAMTAVPIAFMVRGTFHAMFGGVLYPFILMVLLISLSRRKIDPN